MTLPVTIPRPTPVRIASATPVWLVFSRLTSTTINHFVSSNDGVAVKMPGVAAAVIMFECKEVLAYHMQRVAPSFSLNVKCHYEDFNNKMKKIVTNLLLSWYDYYYLVGKYRGSLH
ncbi:hypothetical protein HELRODRAFT_168057 [Helobdella robusta]|uniref:Uncharacterized protein n=1 Tax=Helobdella robusta TaxID=6412 RepID=T1F045_HELRO|nr:hypothetical protein HELRODRAFT_168057 [Helobdella robusta]ESO10185.1 hypothetical protein HELRODRAFT_168057 [Helobdella robusta]